MVYIKSFFDVRPSKAGFTLLEMVIVLAVLSLGLLPIMLLFSSGITASSDATNRSVAVQLAQQKMEQIKGLSYSDIESTSEAFGQISGFSNFSRAVTSSTAEGSPDLIDVKVNVQWQSGPSIGSYEVETFIANY
ncbi:MAG: prepilin-type N-terminal cleavage/methylation domain-containing protein [Candidatus Saganbacteria bacterium]|nr:prepilin-type N-terminal cleavage/methylation domain-containing protein [Candidatus Saganbacteria bacterium]